MAPVPGTQRVSRASRRRGAEPVRERAASLTFYGAAGQVTGSCYLLDTGDRRVLLECGLFQGPPEVEALNERPFPFEPRALDAVILSHAHLDHSGLLPKLVRAGYAGPIYVTPPTRDLLEILLKDAAFLQARDVEREKRHGARDAAPLYTMSDVEQTIALCRTVEYNRPFEAAGGVVCRFHDAGHIIGSAIVELDLGARRLVFSGDLGNRDSLLQRGPATLRAADVLLLESTYGDRDHRSIAATLEEFEGILAAAAEQGGNVIIPAFAVERTQEILYFLGELYEAGRLPQQRIFLDSPMAIAATEIYRKYEPLLNGRVPGTVSHGGRHRVLPPLQHTLTPEESAAINRITGGAIIIAGSGMCNGGRVRFHLKQNLWRAQAHIVIVGYQARGTPGRALVDGAKTLKLLGEEVPVRAAVHTLGGFSAHAGQTQLIEWVAGFIEKVPRIYLVHGEPDKMEALRSKLEERLGARVALPAAAESIAL